MDPKEVTITLNTDQNALSSMIRRAASVAENESQIDDYEFNVLHSLADAIDNGGGKVGSWVDNLG